MSVQRPELLLARAAEAQGHLPLVHTFHSGFLGHESHLSCSTTSPSCSAEGDRARPNLPVLNTTLLFHPLKTLFGQTLAPTTTPALSRSAGSWGSLGWAQGGRLATVEVGCSTSGPPAPLPGLAASGGWGVCEIHIHTHKFKYECLEARMAILPVLWTGILAPRAWYPGAPSVTARSSPSASSWRVVAKP